MCCIYIHALPIARATNLSMYVCIYNGIWQLLWTAVIMQIHVYTVAYCYWCFLLLYTLLYSCTLIQIAVKHQKHCGQTHDI